MGQSVRPQSKKKHTNFNSRSRYTFSFFFWITCGWYLLQTEGAKRGYYKWNQSDFNPDSASQPTNIVLLIFIIITIGRNNQTKTLKLYFNTKYVFNLTRALVRKAHAYPDNHELVVATKTLPISWWLSSLCATIILPILLIKLLDSQVSKLAVCCWWEGDRSDSEGSQLQILRYIHFTSNLPPPSSRHCFATLIISQTHAKQTIYCTLISNMI